MQRYIIIFVLSILLYSIFVRYLKPLKQYERELGPQNHKSKAGTPTMGGLVFVLVPLFFLDYHNPKMLYLYFVPFMYSIIGMLDDILIIVKRNNNGISATVKLVFEVVIAAIAFIFHLVIYNDTVVNLYFFSFDIKWIFGLFILFLLSSSSNAFNITDGIDGLASGLSIIISLTLVAIAYQKNEFVIMNLLIYVTIPLFVFFSYNYPKASIFMGDTGSLFLGAFFAMISIYLDCILAFILLTLVMIVEVLSVIIQVYYYKRKHKRLFKMAPLHHHLELSGISEGKVDIIFFIIELFMMFIILYFRLY